MSATSDIEASINSTNQKKEDLRQAFEFLKSHSSSIISFSLQWKDIEDHFSSIENSITQRFKQLKELDTSSSVTKKPASAVKVEQIEKKPEEIKPSLELKDLCGKMDGEGLVYFITGNRDKLAVIRDELRPAVLSAPDPVALVLNSIGEFEPSRLTTAAELRSIRMTCINLLECLNGSDIEISQESRDRAMEVAVKWKAMITDGKGVNWTVVLCFLILVTRFGLIDSFGADSIFDVIATVGVKKSILDLCKSAAFEGKIPDLIDKLTNSGKQLDAIRYVVAFNLANKYPPAALLKAYLKQAKGIAHEIRVKGNNSFESQNQGTLKEIDAVKSAIKTVEECNLGSLYPIENLQKRIGQLEKQRTEIKQKKRGPAPNSNDSKDPKQLPKKSPNKRPRTSNASVPALSAQRQAHNPAHPSVNNFTRPSAPYPAHPSAPYPAHPSAPYPAHPPPHNPAQVGAVDRPPYGDFPGSYSWGAGQSLYNHGNSSFPGEYVGLGGSNAPPKSYIHPSESISGSDYYDRVATNGTYNKIGAPAYNPSSYNSSYNPSLYH